MAGESVSPEERALCFVRVWRCPGYTAHGNQFPCHPNEEPGGYDVGFGMMMLSQAPMTLDAANQYARLLCRMVAGAIDGFKPDEPLDPAHVQTFPLTEAGLLREPHSDIAKPLRSLALAEGRLVWTPRRRGFVVAGADARMARNDVFRCEQQDIVRRVPGSDRMTGDRVLTDRGRAWAMVAP